MTFRSCFLVVFVSLCWLEVSHAQVITESKSKHFIKLYDDQMKEGVSLLYEYPMMQQAYFALDGKRFFSDKVAFFKNNHGTFANLNEFFGDRSERYAMRISNTGRIQLFEEIDITAYGGDSLLTNNPKRLATGEVWQFYTKDNGILKKGNYKNLSVDLAESPASLKYLNTFKNLTRLQVSLALIGAGIIGQQLYVRRNESNVLSPQIVLGGLMCGATYFFENPKRDALWLAVDNYKP